MREITLRQLRLNQAEELANAPFKLVSRGSVLGYFVTQLPNVTQSGPVEVEQPEPMLHNDPTSNIQPGVIVARPCRDLSKSAQASGKMGSNAMGD